MKKITLLFTFLIAFGYSAYAQVSAYGFSQNAGTYTDNSAAATAVTGALADSFMSAALPIGFTFTYDNNPYTQFKMSSNGVISFNMTGTSNLTGNDLSAANATSRPIIAPLWDDLDGRATGGSVANYELTGVSPNQVLTIEWRNWEWNWGSTASVISFQIKLYETTNVIEFVYRQEAGAVSSGSATIGIGSATGTGAGSYLNLTSIATPAVSSASSVTNINTKPATGQVYRFTPPTPCTGTPVAGTVSPASQTLLTGQASAALVASGYSSGVTGLIFQWEESDDDGATDAWANAVGGTGATTASYTPPVFASTIYYRLVVTCTNGGATANTASVVLNACSVLTAPYTQGFSATLPSCWNNSGSENWLFANTGTGNHIGNNGVITGTTTSGGYFAWVDDSSPDTANATLTSPMIDVSSLTVPRLRFFELSNNEGANPNSTLNVEVWDGAAWNVMATYNTNTAGWEERIINLSGLTITGPIQVRFIIVESASFYDDIAIDDVTIEESPACLAPTTLSASNITATSADLSWVDGSAGLQFDYEYVVQAAGTGMPAVAPGTGTTFDISSLPAPSGLLTANTAYEFWVRSDCGGSGYSTWTGPYNFTTACDVITVFPYTENFEANTPCWTNAQISGTDNWLRDPAGGSGDISGSHGGTGFMEKNYNTSEALLFSPQFDLTALGTDGRVKVWLHRHASADVDDEYVVYVNTSKSLTGATQLLDLYSLTTITPTVTSTGWYEYVINIPTSFNTSNSVYIIFQGITTAGFSSYDLGVDDFTLEAVPSCTEPTGLAVTNLTDASADVSWTATTGNYEYVLDGVATDPAGLGTALAAETYAATLTPSTTYYFHVRTVCAGSTYSTWSTISFTSPATPPANDECSAAIGLTVNADYLCGVFASGTTAGATDSGVEPTLSVSGYPDNDVWYSFVATQTAHRITLTNVVAVIGTDTDMGIGVYNGPCGALTLVGSSDPDTYNLTGLTIGNTYLVNVYGWYELADDGAQATFDICVGTDPALNSSSFDSNAFLAYPNPVKDVLNLEYNSEISSVRVMNLLGQEVISRNINANSTQVDMSQLSAGAYIVNVTVGDAVKTIKVVKQ